MSSLPRRPAPLRTTAIAALLVLLAACTSSTSGTGSGSAPAASSPGGSAAASPGGPVVGGSTASGSAAGSSVASSASSASSAAPGSGSSATGASTTRPAPARPLRTVTVQGVHTSYVIKIWAEVKSSTCGDHAYGAAVVGYLRKHPCHGLTRQLGTTTVNRRAVGFARSVLGFRGAAPAVYTVAGDFETLVSRNGTGNLVDLFRDGYRLPDGPTRVPSPDAFNVQGQDAGVIVLDAWYLSGRTPGNDPALTQLGEETSGQF